MNEYALYHSAFQTRINRFRFLPFDSNIFPLVVKFLDMEEGVQMNRTHCKSKESDPELSCPARSSPIQPCRFRLQLNQSSRVTVFVSLSWLGKDGISLPTSAMSQH
jgi:hypothetical protein